MVARSPEPTLSILWWYLHHAWVWTRFAQHAYKCDTLWYSQFFSSYFDRNAAFKCDCFYFCEDLSALSSSEKCASVYQCRVGNMVTILICGSICWRRCSRWNWQGQSSGAVLDWRRSDTKCPSLYAWVWPSEVAVGEASMQARRKARRASCECKADAGSNLGRARDCWKIGNAVLHLYTNKCVHCMVLCLWAPDLRERICATRCNKDWQSNERRVFTSFPQSLARWTFSNYFNQSLEQVTLPSSLQNLSFGFDFNQSLERVTLPSSLQRLSLGDVKSKA